MDSNILRIETQSILYDVLDRRSDSYSDTVDVTDLRDDEIGQLINLLMKRDNFSSDYILEANESHLRQFTILVNDLMGATDSKTYELVKADLAELLAEITYAYYKSDIVELIEDNEPAVREQIKAQYDFDQEC